MKKALLLLSFALFFAGCAKPDDPVALRLRLKQDLTTLDPAFIVDVPGGRVAAKLFNGLIRYDENLKLTGDLAHKWESSKDGLTYRFTLRPNITFSNGRSVMAEDVRYSLERIRSIETLSPRQWTLDKVDSIQTEGDSVVKIKLKEPYSPFLSLLTLPSAYIVPKEAVERTDRSFARAPVGTGPFQLKEWRASTKNYLGTKSPLF